MKLEKFKDSSNKKKYIPILIVVVAVVGILVFRGSFAKFSAMESVRIAEGTVNYTPSDIDIVAAYVSNGSGSYSVVTDIPTSGYVVNESRSTCTNGATVSGESSDISIKSLSKTKTKCTLYFDLKPSGGNTLAKLKDLNDDITPKTTTPDFSKIATTDEGVFEVDDPLYGEKAYYWRGATTTNHLIFANKCWLIVRINGDGSIRLIYNGTVGSGNTCIENNPDSIVASSQAYNSSNEDPSYVGWTFTEYNPRPTLSIGSDGLTTGGTPSNAKTQTDNWVNNTSNFTAAQKTKIANGKFCNDRNIATNNSYSASSDFYYKAYDRTTPTLECSSEDIYILKAGLITADEVAFAGGKNSTYNYSYYLYNEGDYWTMSPYSYLVESGANVVAVYSNGSFAEVYVSYNNYGIGVRPVINLVPDINISGGKGTTSSPFIAS